MTDLNLPVRDARQLAAALVERGLPGQRSMTAIGNLRRARASRQAPVRRPDLADRVAARIVALYTEEIARRGGEVCIESGRKRSDLVELPLTIADRADGLVVLHVEGWRFYSRGYGSRRAAISYLCGTDDSGRWAVRVPGTILSVHGALSWVTPAEVGRAMRDGRRVRRQGDIYAVEVDEAGDTPSGWVGGDWRLDGKSGARVTSHWWNAETRRLVHRPADGRRHRPVQIGYPVEFVQQRVYEMGRTATRGPGD